MGKKDQESQKSNKISHDLGKAMRTIRSAQADRDDIIIDMIHAKVSRLQLLADDLMPVIDEIPQEAEQFEFAITNGETPRLWIDMTSFVRMGADGREYEFVKDTRVGRTILARSQDRDLVGERITAYVAERLLERERMIEGDWVSTKMFSAERDAEIEGIVEESGEAVADDLMDASRPQRSSAITELKTTTAPQRSGGSIVVWFLVGLAIGLAVLLGLAYFDQERSVAAWLSHLLHRS